MLFSANVYAGGSSPGFVNGQVPTAAQWNGYFASKLDWTPGLQNTMGYWDGSGNFLNAPVSGGCTAVANVFTCSATNLIGILPVANGGTGSSTQNFVDLVTTQNIVGAKTFAISPLIPSATTSAGAVNLNQVQTSGANNPTAYFANSIDGYKFTNSTGTYSMNGTSGYARVPAGGTFYIEDINSVSVPVVIAPAVTSTQAVTLGQGDGRYAALAGSTSQVFNVAPALTTTQAIVLSQLQTSGANNPTAYFASGTNGYNFTNSTGSYNMSSTNGYVRVPLGGTFFAEDTNGAPVPVEVANAVAISQAVNLGQGDGRYASLGQMPLVGTTASIGGAALSAGACASATTTVIGATTSMVVATSPRIYPGDGADWASYVSTANTVVTKVCAFIALTPVASLYNLRVIQ